MTDIIQCLVISFIIGSVASALLIWSCCVVSGRCSRQEEAYPAEVDKQNRIDAQYHREV